MKSGGNYTEPDYDSWKNNIVKYNVFVGGIKIGSYDSDAEATQKLHEVLEERANSNAE